MKVFNLRNVVFVASVMLGLLVSYNACLAQYDAELVGGCDGCEGNTPWIDCDDQCENRYTKATIEDALRCWFNRSLGASA